MNARVDALYAHDRQGPEPTALRTVSPDDKYPATTGEIYLSGIQALVRLALMQRLRDQAGPYLPCPRSSEVSAWHRV